MRLILRTHQGWLQMLRNKKYGFSTQSLQQNPDEEELTIGETSQFKEGIEEEDGQNIKPKYMKRNKKVQGEHLTSLEFYRIQSKMDLYKYMLNTGTEYKIQNEWGYVPHHLFHSDYSLISSPKGQQPLNKKLKTYEDQLKLNSKVLKSKLYDESSYYQKVLKYHLSQMDPLVVSFMKQGYKFLDKRLTLHLIKNKKIKTLKQLMLLEAFEEVTFIDQEVILAIMKEVEQDQRSKFLINLIPFEFELLWGKKPRVIEHSLVEQLKFSINESNFAKYLSMSQGSNEINRLRLLWSFQRYYLVDYSLFEYIIPELKRLRFEVDDPFRQQQITREISFILDNAFDESRFIPFFFNVIEMTKSYHNFLKTWSLLLILFSKLKAMPKIVNQQGNKELDQIFNLFKLNLPENVAHQLLNDSMDQLLGHPIWLDNYQQCWMSFQGRSKHQNSTIHSPLSSILTNQQTSFKVIYEQNESAEPYARTVVSLTKIIMEEKQEKKPKNQADMIRDLMKGDYQSVLDHFLMRYSLPSDFDLSARFHKQLVKTDKNLTFKNEQEKALYKLKQANNFFFQETMGRSLHRQLFETTKQNAVLLALNGENHLEFGKGSQEQIEYDKFQKKFNSFIKHENINLVNADVDLKQNNKMFYQQQKQEDKDQEQVSAQDENVVAFLQMTNKGIENLILSKGESLELIQKMPLKERFEKMKYYTNLYIKKLEEKSDKLSRKSRKKQSHLEKLKEQILKQANKTDIEDVDVEIIGKELVKVLRSYDLADLPDVPSITEEQINQIMSGDDSQKPVDRIVKKMEMKIRNKQKNDEVFLKKMITQILEKDGLKEGEAQKMVEFLDQAVRVPSFKDIQRFKSNKYDYDEQFPLDKAREDRFIANACDFAEVLEMDPLEQQKKYTKILNKLTQKYLKPDKKLSKKELNEKEMDQYFQLVAKLPELSVSELYVLENLKKIAKKFEAHKVHDEFEIFDMKGEMDGHLQRQGKHDKPFLKPMDRKQPERKPFLSKPQQKKPTGFLRNPNKFDFSTQASAAQEPSTEVTTPEPEAPVFDLQKLSEYKRTQIDQSLYEVMKNQNHIPSVGSGISVAKYLFLQGKKSQATLLSNPNKKMNIEFTSVVGTRTKNYTNYVTNTVFNYELDNSFYEQLLEDQLQKFNRHHFKQIVAHMIYFKSKMTDQQIALICKICEKHRIGYSFVEIAQFIKLNDIRISEEALETLTLTWHRFRIINQDMLTFVREYCRKMNIVFRTSFYSHFCASLIRNKDFDKLRDLCTSVLAEIKPKTFKVDNNMKASEVPALEKAWKIQQKEENIKMYLELIENIVINLDRKIPDFALQLFTEYNKMVPVLGEKQLGYGLVCCSMNIPKFSQLMVYLEKNPKLGTEFIYDCLMKALLSNFQNLQDFSERMFDSTVLINRLQLNLQRIEKALIIFKKSSSSNSFSKFLEHCLRFQPDISGNNEIKKEMFFILNNNVQDVSVGGVFNLLDFIFNEKRTQEREEYRALKLSEEEKERKLAAIQGSVIENDSEEKEDSNEPGEIWKPADEKKMSKQQALAHKQKLSKKDIKQIKKEKREQRKKIQELNQQFVAEGQDDNKSRDLQIVGMIRGQTKQHVSFKRRGVLALGHIFQGTIELMKAEEEASKEAEKKVDVKGAKGTKTSKKKK